MDTEIISKRLEAMRDNIRRLERHPMFFLVEDEPGDAEAIRKEIDAYFMKCHILTFGSGEDAAGFLKEFRPDAVFVDLKLPGMSGLDLVDHIKARYDVSVIVVTGLPEHEQLTIEALKHGVVKIVTKPVSQADLKELFGT